MYFEISCILHSVIIVHCIDIAAIVCSKCHKTLVVHPSMLMYRGPCFVQAFSFSADFVTICCVYCMQNNDVKQIPAIKDYSQYCRLQGTPRVGDLLAYRVCAVVQFSDNFSVVEILKMLSLEL